MDPELICMVMALLLPILILYAIGNILSAATFLLCDSVFLSVVGGMRECSKEIFFYFCSADQCKRVDLGIYNGTIWTWRRFMLSVSLCQHNFQLKKNQQWWINSSLIRPEFPDYAQRCAHDFYYIRKSECTLLNCCLFIVSAAQLPWASPLLNFMLSH